MTLSLRWMTAVSLICVAGCPDARDADSAGVHAIDKAFHSFEKACAQGYAHGCFNLGVAYETGEGVPKNQVEARTAYDKACQTGDADGCFNLAACLYEGAGGDKDDTAALAHFGRACELGIVTACTNAASMYELGEGTPKNSVAATSLYKRACEGGDRDACSPVVDDLVVSPIVEARSVAAPLGN
jgi:TPR repeat protein